MRTITELASDLRELRAELLRQVETVEAALKVLQPGAKYGGGGGGIGVVAAPQIVRPPADPPARAADGQPNGKVDSLGRRARRQFTDAEKRQAVALAGKIGINATARQLDVSRSVLFKWTRLMPAAAHASPPTVILTPSPTPGGTSKISFADRVRADAAVIDARREVVAANGDRPKATMVPSGLPRQPVDETAARRQAMAAAYPQSDDA